MTYKLCAAFIASLSVALTFASNETFGGSAVGHSGSIASAHSTPGPPVTQSFQRYQGRNVGTFWPGVGGGFFYGAPSGEPKVGVTQPILGDLHYTYTYDVPWDAVHRYPQVVSPSEPVVRPYVPGCPAQAVTVPMSDGKEQTVNIVRCY